MLLLLLLEAWDDRYVSTRQENDIQVGEMLFGQGRCSNIEGPGRSKVGACKRGHLGGMDKEEEGEPGPQDKTRDFIAIGGKSSIRRGPFETKKAKVREQGWAGSGRSHWAISQPSHHKLQALSSAAPLPPCLPADSPLGPL
jgi:hypothetical protein